MYIYDIQSEIMHRNHPKHSNFENRCIRYIIWAPDLRNHQKYPQKTLHSIAICSIFFIGMVYFGWYLVIPHVQTVHTICGEAL